MPKVDRSWCITVEVNHSTVNFIANIARQGGGLCLEVNAKVYILKLSISLEYCTKNHSHSLLIQQNIEEQSTWLITLIQLCVPVATCYRAYSAVPHKT